MLALSELSWSSLRWAKDYLTHAHNFWWKEKTNREGLVFSTDTLIHWTKSNNLMKWSVYLLLNDHLWSREKTKEIRLVVLGGALGRHTTRAGRGHEEASGSTFGRKFQSQVGPECQGQRTVFLCVFVFTCIYVYFSYVFFCFTFCVQIGHERAKASRPCIMPRIERPLWGKPISGYNATQPDALIEISHSRLGRLCQMYS